MGRSSRCTHTACARKGHVARARGARCTGLNAPPPLGPFGTARCGDEGRRCLVEGCTEPCRLARYKSALHFYPAGRGPGCSGPAALADNSEQPAAARTRTGRGGLFRHGRAAKVPHAARCLGGVTAAAAHPAGACTRHARASFAWRDACASHPPVGRRRRNGLPARVPASLRAGRDLAGDDSSGRALLA